MRVGCGLVLALRRRFQCERVPGVGQGSPFPVEHPTEANGERRVLPGIGPGLGAEDRREGVVEAPRRPLLELGERRLAPLANDAGQEPMGQDAGLEGPEHEALRGFIGERLPLQVLDAGLLLFLELTEGLHREADRLDEPLLAEPGVLAGYHQVRAERQVVTTKDATAGDEAEW